MNSEEKTVKDVFNSKVIIGLEIGGTNIKVNILKIQDNFLEKEFKITSIDLKNGTISKIFNFKTTDNPISTITPITEAIIANISDVSLIQKIGISSFGPLGISKQNDKYGFILTTPKKGWTNFDLIGTISSQLQIGKELFEIETDVNAAAILEYKYGSHYIYHGNNPINSLNKVDKAKKISSLAYITIGTGCGIGIYLNDNLIHGLLHPEGGHMRISKRHNDSFEGVCCYHKDCVEGLITNVSIRERKKLSSVDDVGLLSDDDEIWDIISDYIAQVCLNLVYITSVEKIIIGGGIINRECLLPKIRKYFLQLNNDYIKNDLFTEKGIVDFIVRTEFKNESGILSALSLCLNN